MVFSSYVFLFYFLPAALLLYFLSPRRASHLVLALLSYAFYGWANPLFVLLLFVSTLVDYTCGLVIAGRGPAFLPRLLGARRLAEHWARPIERLLSVAPRTRRQRIAVACSIGSNLALLGFSNTSTSRWTALMPWLRGLVPRSCGWTWRFASRSRLASASTPSSR